MFFHKYLAVALVSLLLIPSVGFAHPGHMHFDLGAGFLQGILHPMTGLDHLLALLGIGIWAAQQNVRRMALPIILGCSLSLVLGVAISLVMFSNPLWLWADWGVAGSLILLGLLISLNRHVTPVFGVLLAGTFMLWHGLLHGAVMVSGVTALVLTLGMLVGSLMLAAAASAATNLVLNNHGFRGGIMVRVLGVGFMVAGILSFAHS